LGQKPATVLKSKGISILAKNRSAPAAIVDLWMHFKGPMWERKQKPPGPEKRNENRQVQKEAAEVVGKNHALTGRRVRYKETVRKNLPCQNVDRQPVEQFSLTGDNQDPPKDTKTWAQTRDGGKKKKPICSRNGIAERVHPTRKKAASSNSLLIQNAGSAI